MAKIVLRNTKIKNINCIFNKPILWTPYYLQNNLQLWLDVQDLSTVFLNGSNVVQLTDKSSYGRNAFNNTASQQPIYEINGISSFPSLKYQIAGQRLNLLQSIPISDDMMTISVFQRSLSSINSIDIGSNNINSTPFGIWWGTTNFINGGLGGTAIVDQTIFGNSTSTGNFIAVTKRFPFSTNQMEMWINGSQFGPGKAKIPLDRQLQTIGYRPGANQTHNGLIGEIIVVVGNANIINQQKVEGYLAHKWNIHSNLPTNHPYKNEPPFN
jgi:hypothetical protein